jgi:hypothetical protein
MEFTALGPVFISPQISDKLAHIGLLRNPVASLMGVKITVGAFAHAPGNMDIQR